MEKQRKPLSLFKKFIILVFCVVSAFGIYDMIFPSKPIQQDPTKNWKTYKDNTLGFTIKYPPTTTIYQINQDASVQNAQTVPVITKVASNSVMFTPEKELAGPPLYYLSYNALTPEIVDIIFALPVGQELDTKTSQEISGQETAGVYKRLPDETINGNTFMVFENPQGYGGKDRRLFLKKNGTVYMTGLTYQNEDKLNDFYYFYSSLKFH